jgi:hypothetical protein
LGGGSGSPGCRLHRRALLGNANLSSQDNEENATRAGKRVLELRFVLLRIPMFDSGNHFVLLLC